MDYKISYSEIKGIERVVIYKSSTAEAARKMFNMLTSNRNADRIISIEVA
jgi:hypothetical protein